MGELVENLKQCWVCLETEQENLHALWLQPCRCRGTAGWVHRSCLQLWLDEKQRGDMDIKVACPQCNTTYFLVFPSFGPVPYLLDLGDRMVLKLCPYVAVGLSIASMYWTAATYGALTVMQILGQRESLAAMEQMDSLFMLIGLPTIPLLLILCKKLRWIEFLARLFHRHSDRIPLIKYLFTSCSPSTINDSTSSVEAYYENEPISATRTFCGALAFPSLAIMTGKTCFPSVTSKLRRFALGGVTFVVIKAILKIYLRNMHQIRLKKRRIIDFKEHSSVTFDQ